MVQKEAKLKNHTVVDESVVTEVVSAMMKFSGAKYLFIIIIIYLFADYFWLIKHNMRLGMALILVATCYIPVFFWLRKKQIRKAVSEYMKQIRDIYKDDKFVLDTEFIDKHVDFIIDGQKGTYRLLNFVKLYETRNCIGLLFKGGATLYLDKNGFTLGDPELCKKFMNMEL